MSDPIVPAATRLAAKRGFVRTAAQSLATGFAVPGALTLAFTGDGLLALGMAVAGMLFAALVNGAQSYFSIIGQGVPDDYRDATLAAHSVLDPVEQQTDVNHAVEVAARHVSGEGL